MTEPPLPRHVAGVALDARAELGEGPHWDEAAGVLIWVDIMVGAVHRFDPATGADAAFSVGQPVGAAIPRLGGGLVLALRDGIAVVDSEQGGELRWVAEVERDGSRTRMNDAACDAAGRLWAGTMDLEERDPIGTLYRVGADGAADAVVVGVTVSNGLGWSPDGGTLYYIDSPKRALEAFDFELATGALSNRRTVSAIEPEAGEPDGLSVDAEGCIWVALWEGAAVRRYRPDGSLAAVVEVAAARVTSCAFGGPGLETMFITTARPDRPDAGQPHAGAVFSVRPGVRGQPAHRFAG